MNARLRARPITPMIGAEYRELDLATVNADDAAALIAELAERKVLVFRNQQLTGSEYARFGRLFGEPVREDLVPGDGRPDVVGSIHIQADEVQQINYWHMDHSFREHPSDFISLYAQILPPCGGDTLFTNLEAAYDGLSGEMKERIHGLFTEHGYRETQNTRRRYTPEEIAERVSAPAIRHPLVARNPTTGRPYLFVNTPVYCHRIADMDARASERLLAELYQHVGRPEFGMRLVWEPGTLVIWENSHCLHYPVADYLGHERLLWRMVVPGNAHRPQAA